MTLNTYFVAVISTKAKRRGEISSVLYKRIRSLRYGRDDEF